MLKTFGEFVRHLRNNLLEKNYNDLAIEIFDDYVTFKLYEFEQITIAYYPFERSYRNDKEPKIVVVGLTNEIEDLIELEEIYTVVNAIRYNKDLINKEIFNYNDKEADV